MKTETYKVVEIKTDGLPKEEGYYFVLKQYSENTRPRRDVSHFVNGKFTSDFVTHWLKKEHETN